MNNLNLYPFVEKWLEKGQSIWLYSDPHFGDIEAYALRNNLISYKDKDKYSIEELIKLFPDIVEKCKEQDELQIKNINSTVGRKGIFVCLGDVGDIEYVRKIRASYKILIQGNHDKGKTYYQREITEEFSNENMTEEDKATLALAGWSGAQQVIHNIIRKYTRVIDNHLFDEVYDGKLQITNNIVLSHEIVNDEFAFNIHGHDHNCSLMRDYLDFLTVKINPSTYLDTQLVLIKKLGLKNLNLCAEWINYKPVLLNSIIKSGLLSDIPNIHRKAIDKQIENSRK